MLAVVPTAPQVLLCALILTWSVGKKTNVQNMREKNQVGPRETGCCFSLIPAALGLLQLRESRERGAGHIQILWLPGEKGLVLQDIMVVGHWSLTGSRIQRKP